MYGRISDLQMAPYSPRVAVRTPGWGVRGGIDPGDHVHRARFVGVVEVWKDFWSGDGNSSSPGGSGSTNPCLG